MTNNEDIKKKIKTTSGGKSNKFIKPLNGPIKKKIIKFRLLRPKLSVFKFNCFYLFS